MTIELINEFNLSGIDKRQIADLLRECFPNEEFNGRIYFKQLPHYRLLVKGKDKVFAQLALDYRVMTQNGNPIRVMGLVDLAVLPSYQKQGIGTMLLKEVDKIAKQHSDNIDFLFLTTKDSKFYDRNGYKLTKQKVSWLTIENHVQYGLKELVVHDCLMYKQVRQKEWIENATLDMLGYWY